jgi:hypothetical protein
MPKGKGSKARYRAMLEDVEKRAWYALSSGDHANPYAEDDKRHARFVKKLLHIRRVDSDFEDMCDAHGCDTSAWTKRQHPHPGPVVPLAQLV